MLYVWNRTQPLMQTRIASHAPFECLFVQISDVYEPPSLYEVVLNKPDEALYSPLCPWAPDFAESGREPGHVLEIIVFTVEYDASERIPSCYDAGHVIGEYRLSNAHDR